MVVKEAGMRSKRIAELFGLAYDGLSHGPHGYPDGSNALDELRAHVERLEAAVESAKRLDVEWEAFAESPSVNPDAVLEEARSDFFRALAALDTDGGES